MGIVLATAAEGRTGKLQSHDTVRNPGLEKKVVKKGGFQEGCNLGTRDGGCTV